MSERIVKHVHRTTVKKGNFKYEQFENTEQELLIITADKVRIILDRFAKDSRLDTTRLLSVLFFFISIFLAILSSDFHDFVGIPAVYFKALFCLIAIVVFIYWLYFLICYLFCRKYKGTEDIIEEIKNRK